MTIAFADAESVMRRAIELAERGRGFVEPNPCVGAVLVDDARNLIAEGFHAKFGGPHAEIEALRAAGERARGAVLFSTLEPCCHTGKTGPCTSAIIAAGVRKVLIGVRDPAPHVAGGGIATLRAAGVEVQVGVLHEEALRVTAPFLQLVTAGRPWVHAKWAMTLDGKIATRTGHSQWISNDRSRRLVHEMRGRMDAIIVGARTARLDDPLLTPRPPGPRVATRIVIDGSADLPLTSQLVRTAGEVPVLLATLESAPGERCKALTKAGVEILRLPAESVNEDGLPPPSPRPDLRALFAELGHRRMSNVLVEGGGALLGSLFDQGLIDETHVFISPKLVGGREATSPLAGRGLAEIPQSPTLIHTRVEILDGDLYVHGMMPSSLSALEQHISG